MAGLVAFVAYGYGWVRGRSFVRPAPIALAMLLGFLDVQTLLGLAMFAGGRRPPGIVEHLSLALGGVIALHLVAIVNRRRPQPTGYGLPLLGVTLAIVLVLMGIHALGRPFL